VSTPNLLFITTDQQRWDSLPCYGLSFMRTPHLDRLAREGLVFDHAYTPAPLCVPARASLLSGQWPSTTGVLGNNHGLAADTPTWPARLSAAGYRTAAIGKMHFYPWDARQGFEERISAEDKRHVYLQDDFVKFLRAHGHERVHPTTNPGYFESLGAPVTPLPKRFHVDGFTGDQAADWLARHGHEPFAAWVSFAGPHDPYDPPEEMAAMYADAPIPVPIGSRAELATKPRAQQRANTETINNSMFRIDPTQATPEQHRRWRAHYYANISLIDEGIGKILAALEATDALERTLIIFTSDHGDALGDHGLAYKSFFYDCMARVPLIVRGPGVAAGQRCPALVSLLDLVPLFYGVAGVEPPPTLEGVDLTPLLQAPTGPGRSAVFSENLGALMVRDARYKYVHYADGDCELYDLSTDPTEERNLADDSAAAPEIARLRALLLEHTLRSHRVRALPVARPQEPARVRLEAEYRRQRQAQATGHRL
jgi:choline-sulfatase